MRTFADQADYFSDNMNRSTDRLRQLLGLNSTAFTIEVSDGSILITTLGKGHRVGMSQYGANSMAKQGSGWEEIVLHYYPGTDIVPALTIAGNSKAL